MGTLKALSLSVFVGPNIDPHKVFGRLGMVGNIDPRWLEMGFLTHQQSPSGNLGFSKVFLQTLCFLAGVYMSIFGLRTSSQTIKESLENFRMIRQNKKIEMSDVMHKQMWLTFDGFWLSH